LQNSPPHAEIYALFDIGVAKPGGRVKKEIKNREWFLIQVFKRLKGINIILLLFQGS
jgi:hypothetical protein